MNALRTYWPRVGLALTGLLALALLILNVFAHNTTNIFLAGAFLVVAVILLLLTYLVPDLQPNKQSLWGRMVDQAAPLLFLLAVITYILQNTVHITWFPEVIVAWGTLFLAFATYQLGQTTIQENKKVMEHAEKVTKEERERESKRRRLDEMQHWTDIAATLAVVGMESPSVQYEKTHLTTYDITTQARTDRMGTLLSRRRYLALEAKRLDQDIDALGLKSRYKRTAEAAVNTVSDILAQWLEKDIWAVNDLNGRVAVAGECELLQAMVSDLRAGQDL